MMKSVILWHAIGDREYEEKAKKHFRCGRCKKMMHLVPYAQTYPGWHSPTGESAKDFGVLYQMEHVVPNGDEACEFFQGVIKGARM